MPLIVYISRTLDLLGHDMGQFKLLSMRTEDSEQLNMLQRLGKYGVGDFKAL